MCRACVFGDNTNTDLILSASAFLLLVEEQFKDCLSAHRPNCSDLVEPGDILVAGATFGVVSARPIGNVLSKLGIAGVVTSSFNGLGLRNCVDYRIYVLPCPDVGTIVADRDSIAVDWQAELVRNCESGAQLQGKPLPDQLLDVTEKVGIVSFLESEGLLEDVE